MTEEQIKAECIRRDQSPALVYYLDLNRLTFSLRVNVIPWDSLIEGDRWCMVKSRNIFDSLDEARAAIERALSKPQK